MEPSRQKSTTLSSTNKTMEELYKEHGIPYKDMTKEWEGKASIMFTNRTSGTPTNSQLSESEDAAATALHYHNLRKGH